MPTPMPREEAEVLLREAKQMGFSDRQLAHLWDSTEAKIARLRRSWGITPVYKTVDTCAAEFEAYTPYHYSTYEQETEVRPCDKEKIIILGGGPNRIGQGIEFDYCCCHAVFALRELGYETIMVNSNPETVSTDYDTSNRLYFEPLTFEDVMNLVEAERPKGVIIQFGGQTPLKLAVPLERAGVPVLGTSPDSIDLAEDRKRFGALIEELGIRQPENGTASSFDEARLIAEKIQYPVLVRPSYVLGGRAMEIVYDEEALSRYFREAVQASPDHPVLVDRYLEDAIEVDVDAVGDGTRVYIGGIMEHIEYAGVHSGDSACVIPPRSLSAETVETLIQQTRQLTLRLGVKGLINIQYAISTRHGQPEIYVLEVNPRGSRTVPFVSKATGVPLAKVAARAVVGVSLDEQGLPDCYSVNHQSVKEAVLPFVKFPNVDPLLGPEMRSTGEVMGIDMDFGLAYAKAQMGPGTRLPEPGADKNKVIVSLRDTDKAWAAGIAGSLVAIGFEVLASLGTHTFLHRRGIPSTRIYKVHEGTPNFVNMIESGQVGLVINTPMGEASEYDERALRRSAVETGIPYVTTIAAANAAIEGIVSMRDHPISVKAIQDYYV